MVNSASVCLEPILYRLLPENEWTLTHIFKLLQLVFATTNEQNEWRTLRDVNDSSIMGAKEKIA